MPQELQDKIRYQVNRFIYERGFAPNTLQLAELLSVDEAEIKTGLTQLAENHAIVLHPGTHHIWVAHPFALSPTLFWVKSGEKTWWGNCIWCALGIAALAKADTEIHTKVNGEQDSLVIHVKNGAVQETNLLVHFPIPAKRFWDNVVYTCACMVVFTSEEVIDDWCKRHNMKKGEVVPINQVWELAQLWYGYYLDPNWTRKTPELARSIFKKVGLTSEFWVG